MGLIESAKTLLTEAWAYAGTRYVTRDLTEDVVIFGVINDIEPFHDRFEAEFQVYRFDWPYGYAPDVEYTMNQDIIDQLKSLSVGQPIRIMKKDPNDVLKINVSAVEVVGEVSFALNLDSQGFTQLKIA